MQRRKFIQNIGIGSLAFPLASFTEIDKIAPNNNSVIIPQGLKEGDTVGVVSPSSAIFETEPYEIARENLEAMGLKVKFGAFVKGRYGHLAGTDEERAGELNEMFRDDNIQAVMALRGGSGAARILDKLDYETIKNNPKIFIGYSDITALHLAIYEKNRTCYFSRALSSFYLEHFQF